MCPPGALFKQWSIRKAASVVQRHNANYPQDNKPGFGASLELSIDDEHLMKRVMLLLLYIYMHSMCIYSYIHIRRVYLNNCLGVVGCRLVFREDIMHVDCISTSVSIGYCII